MGIQRFREVLAPKGPLFFAQIGEIVSQKCHKLVFPIRRRKMVAMIRSKTSDRVLKQENNPATSFSHKRTRIADRWRAGGPEKCKNPALFAENSCKNGAPFRTEDRPPERAPVLTQEAHIPWADGVRRPPTPMKHLVTHETPE